MDNAKQFCTFMDTGNFIMNKNDMHELCTLDKKYKNGIQLRVISFEKIKKMGVLCLHMHSGTGYAITSLSLLLLLGSGLPFDFL